MSTDRIEKLCKDCELSKSSYYRVIKHLLSQGVIRKVDGGFILADFHAAKKKSVLPIIYKSASRKSDMY